MTTPPLVTVLVPARNEAADIETCLAAVLAQDHPLDRLEVLVVDGGSTDGTADVAGRVLEQASDVRWKVLENAAGTTPSNLNHGLAAAQGDYLCRVDARSIVPPHYVRTCVEVLAARPDVAVVGGSQVAVTRPGDGPTGRGIARALNNRWGMGFSRYRRGARSGPADTVYLGAFRTPQLRGARGWDERMLSNQDYELNRRLGRHGAVWFDDRLAVGYLPRQDLVALAEQYHRFGRWKVRYWRLSGDRPVARQWAVLGSPLVALLAVAWAGRAPARRLPVLALLGLGGLAAVEVGGSDRPADAGVAGHAVAGAALVTIGAGWLSGVAAEALAGPRPSP